MFFVWEFNQIDPGTEDWQVIGHADTAAKAFDLAKAALAPRRTPVVVVDGTHEDNRAKCAAHLGFGVLGRVEIGNGGALVRMFEYERALSASEALARAISNPA